MDRIIEILNEIRPDVDFINEKNLIDDGILDSFDVVSIISDLSDEFDIKVKVSDLGAHNFNSLETITSMVERLKK
jgi:D-alanine--poly(phosphoribitol) ligase subunit 2